MGTPEYSKLLSVLALESAGREKGLTGQERLIVILTGMSWTRKQIAEAIMRSVKTVDVVLKESIERKIGGSDVAFLTRYAKDRGWLKRILAYQ